MQRTALGLLCAAAFCYAAPAMAQSAPDAETSVEVSTGVASRGVYEEYGMTYSTSPTYESSIEACRSRGRVEVCATGTDIRSDEYREQDIDLYGSYQINDRVRVEAEAGSYNTTDGTFNRGEVGVAYDFNDSCSGRIAYGQMRGPGYNSRGPRAEVQCEAEVADRWTVDGRVGVYRDTVTDDTITYGDVGVSYRVYRDEDSGREADVRVSVEGYESSCGSDVAVRVQARLRFANCR